MKRDDKAILAAKKYMLRKCATGSTCACTKVKKVLASQLISIHAGSMVTFMDANDKGEHVNQLPFKGILLLTDVASTKPPHGSRGHRIYVPTAVAERKLQGIVGMGINYDQTDLDSHVTRHKVGVVTKAWQKGNQTWVSGFVWKKDFPEAVRDLKRGGLGMSMELADVYVRDENEDVWHLEDFEFTGATILKKSAAAYYGTELVASSQQKRKKILTLAAAAVGERKRKGDGMKTQKEEKKVIAAASDTGQGALLVGAMKSALSEAMSPVVLEIKASNERVNSLQNDLEELKGLFMIQAAAHEDDDDEENEMAAGHEEEDDEEMAASGKNKQDDDQDDDEEDDDAEGEQDDLDAMEDLQKEAAEEDPGELNKDAKNQGDKTTVENKVGQREKVSGNIAKGRLSSSALAAKAAKGKRPFPGLKSSASIEAAAIHINTLTAQIGQLRKQNKQLVREMQAQADTQKKQMKRLSGQYAALEAQAEKWSDQVERKSVIPVDIRNLAAKNGANLSEVMASGEKIPVEVVDKWFKVAESQGIQIEPSRRAGMKTQMYQMGLMESGEIPFGGVN